MRAWQYSNIEGTLEESIALKLDIPAPKKSALGKDEIIVEVICASLNPVDYKLPESGLIGHIMITRPAIPGLDFCGRVVSKHPSVTALELGQIVFGG
ncbi:zinc-binding oxidoreductase [Colletotrichum truncatum]|uniref:Zinc-binding oxidoreductase n=1 Tax=Colletotrichum truncatum TaxID=5467 RepID=A0ACC3YPW1_COLTU